MDRITLKVPVVLAENDQVQVTVSGREVLDPRVVRITDVTVDIKNLELNVIVLDLPSTWDWEDPETNEEPNYPRFRVKVIISGVLHKQIFWLGPDERIHHMQVNEPFATYVLFTENDVAQFGETFNKLSVQRGFVFDERRLQAQIWEERVEAIVTHLITPSQLQETVVLGFTVKLEQLTQLAIGNNQNS